MNENKQNTALLTVIAVATLLVAVVGATFAYFTTAGSSSGTTSDVEVTGGKMNITYADGTSTINTTGSNAVATGEGAGKTYTYVPGEEALATKTMTIAGENTTDLNMPYTVKLIYTSTFQTNTLCYTITATPRGKATANILVTADNTEGSVTKGKYLLPAESNKPISVISGHFGAGSVLANDTVTIEFELYFLDNGQNQDDDKSATFSGRFEVTAQDALTYTTQAA